MRDDTSYVIRVEFNELNNHLNTIERLAAYLNAVNKNH